ncbi:Nucleosome assembly protein (NAP) domain containing protein, partial [Elaphomyces granulatus]
MAATAVSENPQEQQNGKSLFDRIQQPGVSNQMAHQISLLEHEFNMVELQQLRMSVPLLRPLYEKRNALIASKPFQDGDFWPRVFHGAPTQIDDYIMPSDSNLLGDCFINFLVERFEVDEHGNGEPRSLRFTFEFETGEDNPYFEDGKLVKDLYFRKKIMKTATGKGRAVGAFVSEPVRIRWKPDQDLTRGLLDAACDLFEAEKKDISANRRDLPEYEKLAKKLEEREVAYDLQESNDEDGFGETQNSGHSFFAFFGFRGRVVSPEEHQLATAEEKEGLLEIEEFDGEGEDDSLEEVEIFPEGEDVAVCLAEELWPDAFKYYVKSYSDQFDELEWDLENENGDNDDDDDDDGDEDGDEEGEDEDEDEDDEDEDEERPRKKVKTQNGAGAERPRKKANTENLDGGEEE